MSPTNTGILLLMNMLLATALPAQLFRYSLMIEKNFHSFNHEPVLLKGDQLLIVPSDFKEKNWDNSQYDWFTALIDPSGRFNIGAMAMTLGAEGNLSMKSKEEMKDDDEMSRSVFSIKDGKLCHESVCEFTLCPTSQHKETDNVFSFTIHHPRAPSSECEGRIMGVRLSVLNQQGAPANEFEAPEFLYNTGHRMFI